MFTALAVVAALSAPVPKAPAPELKWKLTKGDTFYVTMQTDATSAVNGPGGGGNVQGSTTASVLVYKATVTAAGEKETTLEVEVLACKAGDGGGPGGGPAKLADRADMVGKRATFTLDPAQKVTRADGVDKFGNAGGMMSAEYFQSNVQDLLRAVPGKALGKGETWKGGEELKMADGLVAKRTDAGKVTGVEDGLAKLEVECEHAWSGNPSGVAFELKGDKGKRTVLFDPKAGRVRKLEETYSLAGTINLGGGLGGPGGGGGQNIGLTMTMKAVVTVTDDPPKGKE